MKQLTGAEIRQSFIDYFVRQGHTFVHSASLVPGGDATLLFTNAGMVQFKDVFLGTDQRPYNRAVNSQKCMRVAGKHNDLDDVGRDDTHHTFFEMLGNWSFGDYYKKEAIGWAWDLLTNEWGIPKELLWTTYFLDEKNEVPMDDEARDYWRQQPGMIQEHVVPGGRKDNFWEMAETGPCGPCSEIHIDRGPDGCDKKGQPGHVCQVNGDCKRYLELWNLVFIQYNRINKTQLDSLPAKHVDTGMGLERIVSVMQEVSSNYRTDLLFPLMRETQVLTKHTDQELEENITPYRVIADHARTSAFLIADGVVPGNTGRNYVCRMIVRRAARFGGKIGLHEPFLARVANVVVDIYGDAFPELKKNRKTILDTLTREEKRFLRTLESGIVQLEDFQSELKRNNQSILDGGRAFDLYATHGLPLELTRDVLLEQGLDVDLKGFADAMEEHRLASGAGKAMGVMGGVEVDIFREILEELQETQLLPTNGVKYDPYSKIEISTVITALVKNSAMVDRVELGDEVDVIIPETCFYIESGGQVSDQGWIEGANGTIEVLEMRKPAAGMIIHRGKVSSGFVITGENVSARVNADRRQAIRRNHTATHLLHHWLHEILGPHAVQAGSLVAPDRLRFDFNHSEAITPTQLEEIEAGVNDDILKNYNLRIQVKGLQDALADGATALFGEKYGQEVRTVSIGTTDDRVSYELCGGTHVDETADIGLFLITSEGSAAAGIRRIEAVTGRGAYDLVKHREKLLRNAANELQIGIEDIQTKVKSLLDDLDTARKQNQWMKTKVASADYQTKVESVTVIDNMAIFGAIISEADPDILRQLTDQFRSKYPSSVILLGCAPEQKPSLICSVTDDLVKKGISAGDIVKTAATLIGGSGGGRPNMAQAGGKDASKLQEAIEAGLQLVKSKI